MTRNLLSIISTNLKVTSRSKISAILVLLAPILIVFLIGTAFNSSSLSGITVGVYSSSYNDLTNSIISNLQDSGFNSEKLDSEEACINSVKSGTSHVCVVFPSDLSVEGNNEKIKIHADNSRMDLAYNLINKINEGISEKGSELGIVMTQSILDVLQTARKSLPLQKEELSSASENVGQIGSKWNSTSSELSESIASLDDAINNLESENASQSIVEDLEALKEDMETINSNEGGIKSLSAETKSQIDGVSSEVDSLISELSSTGSHNAEEIVDPIQTEIKFIKKDSSNWESLFPSLIALIILLSSIVLSSTMVLSERKSRASFRNFMTPTSDFVFVLGTYITCIMIIAIQLIILLAGTVYLTGLNLISISGPIALITFVSASAFIFIGMFIGYLFKSDETTILASISVASLLIFFSNIILPTEAIAGKFKYIAAYNPLFATESVLRKVILFKSNLASMTGEFLIIIAGIVVFASLTLMSRKMTKRFI